MKCADDLGAMHADLMKTRQILFNLLGNAAKFTRGGDITLDVAARRRRRGAQSSCSPSTDTGVGMTPEQTDKIFDPFTQADVDDHPPVRRHRARPRDRVALLRTDGRERVGRERPGTRIPVHRSAAARNGRRAATP